MQQLLLLCSPDGALQIIRLPDQTVLFAAHGLLEGSAVMRHQDGAAAAAAAAAAAEEAKGKVRQSIHPSIHRSICIVASYHSHDRYRRRCSQARAAVKELVVVQSADIAPRFQQPMLVVLLSDGAMLTYKMTEAAAPPPPPQVNDGTRHQA